MRIEGEWQAFDLEMPAMPKARPRMGGNVYMPRKYMAWKQAVAEELIAQGAVLLERPVLLELELEKERTRVRVAQLPHTNTSRSQMLTGDVDNYLGGFMDAAEGVLWANDRNVWGIDACLA